MPLSLIDSRFPVRLPRRFKSQMDGECERKRIPTKGFKSNVTVLQQHNSSAAGVRLYVFVEKSFARCAHATHTQGRERKGGQREEERKGKLDSNKTHVNTAPLFIINMQNERSPALLSLIQLLRDYDEARLEMKMSIRTSC